MGEPAASGVRFVMVEEKRNILVGYLQIQIVYYSMTHKWCRLGIFVGFAAFFFMEKTLRVLGGGDEDGVGHSHSHSHSHVADTSAEKASGVGTSVSQDGLRNRSSDASKSTVSSVEHVDQATNGPSKLSAYLNLFGDFVHNMCVCPFSFDMPCLTDGHSIFLCSTDGLACVHSLASHEKSILIFKHKYICARSSLNVVWLPLFTHHLSLAPPRHWLVSPMRYRTKLLIIPF